ncbi:MAG: transketolase C-terminal domain-containing protein, partial [Bacillota bacterium]|nr:transketolase C-terminal domain-containing protein [Bacillota bacterium]
IRNTYNTEEELFEVVKDMAARYEKNAPELIEYKAENCEGADIVLVSHGIVTRACYSAMEELRAAGIKVGFFRPITLRPFPSKELRQIADNTKRLLVVESAEGQLAKMVKHEIYGCTTPVAEYFRPGLGISSEEVVAEVKKLV